MFEQSILAFVIYFCCLVTIGLIASHKSRTATDFILGGRSLNYWVTAISANASDMSAWLFLGLPMAVYANGVISFWTAIGLIIFMFLNWHIVAPRLRRATESEGALTLSTFFERRLHDHTGGIRLTTALWSLVFLTTYLAANLAALGYLFEMLFGFDFYLGCLIGLFAIVVYTFVGGFAAIAWTDFFQGMFLLSIVVIVPIIAGQHAGGFGAVIEAVKAKNLTVSLVPNWSVETLIQILSLTVGWGFGYFGQPHILNKFMAIKNPNDLTKSKYLGSAWQILALTSSTAIGLVAIAYFKEPVPNAELIFPHMVGELFNPFLAGVILCAVLAATLSTMDSQLLVLASVCSEDLYKKFIHKTASPQQVVWVSRASVIIIGATAFIIVLFKNTSIFELVSYCWVGLGCAFGPLVILSLYYKGINKNGAIAGVLLGGTIGASWNYFNQTLSAMIPGFFGGLITIVLVSWATSANHSLSRRRERAG